MNKTIVVTGATGFVGRKLCLELFLKGYELKILCRSTDKAKNIVPLPAEFISWNGYEPLSSEIFEGAAGVIHLAGESIASGRWTKKRKEAILKSRTVTTEIICEAINKCQTPPPVLVGASAVGIYGEGFLAEVCKAWENSYQSFKGRLTIVRTGVVLGHGGALEKMLLPFRLGGGGKLGDGKQWMSWIHIDDLVKIYIHALENSSTPEIVDGVSPEPVTNKEFTKILTKTLGVPAIIPVPKFGLKLIFGEMSSVLLDSQKVNADSLLNQNFTYSYNTLESALNSLLRPDGHKGAHVLESYQWVNEDKEKVFCFFSEAENLEVITPPWLNFKITKKSHDKIEEGTLIDYKLKIKGVPATWKTLISQWSETDSFRDSQLKGPYSKWEHTHRFISIQGGTLMTDEVIYKAPMGPIGYVVNEIMIKKDVSTIFKFRNKKIKEIFAD